MAVTLRKFWEALRGVNRRQLQFEIDIHRIFLLTSYNKKGADSDISLEEVTELGKTMPFDEQQRLVQENVHEQVARIAAAMDEILLVEPPKKESDGGRVTEEAQGRPSGLSFAVGQEAPQTERQETLVPVETRPLKFSEVSAALQKSIGYTLELKPSQIDHKEAGQGVYLAGRAGPGTVVSFYPGIIYSPSHYRYMPGFPRMDITNSYLISRYDGLIIDGQPWGCGGESRELWDGGHESETFKRVQVENPKDESEFLDVKKTNAGLWSALFGSKESYGSRKSAIMERRNPLALAHFINHPTQGKQPNVILCPYDCYVSDPSIRPYIPNVHFDDDDEIMQRRGLLWVREKNEEDFVELKNPSKKTVVRTLVLVSTRELCDEELFLNYRLSNHKKWPTWYHPVDSEEDKRRWH